MKGKIKKALRDPYLLRRRLLESCYRAPVAGLSSVGSTIGTNVFSRDWDMLVILDTCRIDALDELVDEYDFLEVSEGITSVGAATPEWISATFDSAYASDIEQTAYLAANPSADKILERQDVSPLWDVRKHHLSYRMIRQHNTVESDQLGKLEHLWKYEPKGEAGDLGHESGGTPPRYVTDRAISVGHTQEFDRIIVHYHQPHTPYMANAIEEDRSLKPHEDNPYVYIRETGDRDTVWETYLNELRSVLDEVAILLENVDAEKVVISADHGEAIGEQGEYGHLIGTLNPVVRRVPWVETTATNTETYTPEFDAPEKQEVSADEQLAALGYKF
jgi:hypothetical protein